MHPACTKPPPPVRNNSGIGETPDVSVSVSGFVGCRAVVVVGDCGRADRACRVFIEKAWPDGDGPAAVRLPARLVHGDIPVWRPAGWPARHEINFCSANWSIAFDAIRGRARGRQCRGLGWLLASPCWSTASKPGRPGPVRAWRGPGRGRLGRPMDVAGIHMSLDTTAPDDDDDDDQTDSCEDRECIRQSTPIHKSYTYCQAVVKTTIRLRFDRATTIRRHSLRPRSTAARVSAGTYVFTILWHDLSRTAVERRITVITKPSRALSTVISVLYKTDRPSLPPCLCWNV